MLNKNLIKVNNISNEFCKFNEGNKGNEGNEFCKFNEGNEENEGTEFSKFNEGNEGNEGNEFSKFNEGNEGNESKKKQIINGILTEKILKKRGRKKKIINDENKNNLENQKIKFEENEIKINPELIVKKKRGRKKKWEVETTTKLIDNSPIIFSERSQEQNNEIDNENYEQEQVLFGNLNIKLHTTKEQTNYENIKESLKKNKKKINSNYLDHEDSEDYSDKNSEINYDEILKKELNIENNNNDNSFFNQKLDTKSKSNIKNILDNNKIKLKKQKQQDNTNIKSMKFFSDEYSKGTIILFSKLKCYNCHHNFTNQPYFLPYEFCNKTLRYKVCGNFCSPNCVKSYALNSKLYINKTHLVGEMYRRLLGYSLTIKPAPPIQCLIDYGGNMTIEEYRESFNNKTNYDLIPVCSKISYEEINVKHKF